MLKAELLQNYDEKIKFDYETGLILQNVPWSNRNCISNLETRLQSKSF